MKALAGGLNLLIPGMGFNLLGYYWLSLGFLGSWCLTIAGTCWLGYFTTANGFIILLVLLSLIHLSSMAITFRLTPIHQPLFKSIATAIAFFLGWCLLLTGFISFRDNVFGWDIYHIPSSSMKPTLTPGDVILVDTWRYHNETPKAGDIVLFTRNQQGKKVFIKRVHIAPESMHDNPNQVYVLGDNRAYSTDSRQFGLIDVKLIKGQATLILLDPHGLSLKPLI